MMVHWADVFTLVLSWRPTKRQQWSSVKETHNLRKVSERGNSSNSMWKVVKSSWLGQLKRAKSQTRGGEAQKPPALPCRISQNLRNKQHQVPLKSRVKSELKTGRWLEKSVKKH